MTGLGTLEMLGELRKLVDRAGSQKAAAQQLGVSDAFLCDVLNSRRGITLKVAFAMGYDRVFIYRKRRGFSGTGRS